MRNDRQKKKEKPKKRADIFHDLPPVEDESAEEPEFRHRGLYLLLGALVVGAVVASFVFAGTGWVDRYAAGLATETLGILITLVFVQRFLQRQERARRLRGSIGALRKGSRALSSIAWTWADLIRSSLRRSRAAAPATLSDLFAPHHTESLTQWDPRALRPDSEDGDETAGRWAIRRFHASQDALNEIIVTYGGALDPGYVEAIDELVDDPFLRIIRELAGEVALDPRDWRQRLNAARAYREAHFHRLLQAIAIHNELANEAGQLRSRRTAPRTGSVGLRLPLDHDLKVHLSLDAKWWWTPPEAGSAD